MPNPALTVGGTPLYPMGGLLDPSLPVYRPEYGGGGLLNDGQDFANLRRDFAGGILNGFQYDPTRSSGSFFNAIAPSGVYTANPDEATTVTESGSDVRPLTFQDVLDIKFNPRERQMFMDVFGGTEDDGKTLSIVGLDLSQAYDPENEKWKDAMTRSQVWGDSTTSGGRR